MLDKTTCLTEFYFTTEARMILLKCRSDLCSKPSEGLLSFSKSQDGIPDPTWYVCHLFCYLLDLVPSLSLCAHHTALLVLPHTNQACSNFRVLSLAVPFTWNALSQDSYIVCSFTSSRASSHLLKYHLLLEGFADHHFKKCYLFPLQVCLFPTPVSAFFSSVAFIILQHSITCTFLFCISTLSPPYLPAN